MEAAIAKLPPEEELKFTMLAKAEGDGGFQQGGAQHAMNPGSKVGHPLGEGWPVRALPVCLKSSWPSSGQSVEPPVWRNAQRLELLAQEIPEGQADALTGKTFVISGQLDALARHEAEELIKRHGGRITGGVGPAVSLVLQHLQTCGKGEWGGRSGLDAA